MLANLDDECCLDNPGDTGGLGVSNGWRRAVTETGVPNLIMPGWHPSTPQSPCIVKNTFLHVVGEGQGFDNQGFAYELGSGQKLRRQSHSEPARSRGVWRQQEGLPCYTTSGPDLGGGTGEQEPFYTVPEQLLPNGPVFMASSQTAGMQMELLEAMPADTGSTSELVMGSQPLLPETGGQDSSSGAFCDGSGCALGYGQVGNFCDGGGAHPADRRRFSMRRSDPMSWAAGVVTVMVRQIPRQFTQQMFLQEVMGHGYEGLFDFLYLPYDLKKGINVGYGFINFTEPRHALAFREEFDGFCLDTQMRHRGKPLRVHPASVQGYQANFHHFAHTKTGQKQDPMFSPLFFPASQTIAMPAPSSPGQLTPQCLAVAPGPVPVPWCPPGAGAAPETLLGGNIPRQDACAPAMHHHRGAAPTWSPGAAWIPERSGARPPAQQGGAWRKRGSGNGQVPMGAREGGQTTEVSEEPRGRRRGGVRQGNPMRSGVGP